MQTMNTTTQRIIAHRALLNGPNKKIENSPDTIRTAIQNGFDVEIDVWWMNDQWFLGHDDPQYKIDFDFLLSVRENAWCHAKNDGALLKLLEKRDVLRCFWHEEDTYTITSDGRIWVYPGKVLPTGSICVMPERCKIQENLHNCFGICTDFADIFRIYDEMRARQLKMLLEKGTNPDSLIEKSLIDTRRCIAGFTFYNNWSASQPFEPMLASLAKEFPHQNYYSTSEQAINSIHFTFGQIIGFNEYEGKKDLWEENQATYLAAIKQVLNEMPSFEITFRGLMPIQSGIIMVGYPSIDINIWRRKLETLLANQNLAYSQYQNNIIHSTVLRCNQMESNVQKLIQFANQYQSTYFGTLKVETFHIGHCSWRMQRPEIQVVEEVKLGLKK
jgi:hypothetical protein